jgi:hypothetical protein
MRIDLGDLFDTYSEAIKAARDKAPGKEDQWVRSSQDSVNTLALIVIAEQLKRIADVIEVSRLDRTTTV